MPHRGRRWKRSPSPAVASESISTTSTTSHPSRPNPSLPVELVDLILEHLEDDWEAPKAHLSRCCLVSRAFLLIARPRLYSVVKLGFAGVAVADTAYWHDAATPRLVETIQKNPHLAQLVRRFEVRDGERASHVTTVILLPALVAVFSSCLSITEIAIQEEYLTTARHVLETLPGLLPALELVELEAMSDAAWFLLQTLPRPSLRRLAIDARWAEETATYAPRQPPPHLRLTSLDLSYQDTSVGPFLDFLYPSVAPTLTHLTLFAEYVDILPSFDTFPLLRHLQLSIPGQRLKAAFIKALPSLLKGCSNLRTLTLNTECNNLTLSNVLAISSASPSALAANLPPSLQKLHLHSRHFHPSDLVRLVTAAPQAVNLREIGTKPYELHKGERDRKKRPELPSEEEREELRKVCEERGIRVVAVPRYA